MMRPRVYISGPLTSSGNERENVEAASHAARRLIDAGFAPFCPHLSWYLDQAGEIDHATWMEVDLPWVDVSDAVLRLSGESDGAEIETARAWALGIPIFFSVAEIVEYFQVEVAA